MRATFPEIQELLGASPLGYQLCPSLNPSRSPVGKVGDQLLKEMITKINNQPIIEEL